MSFSFSGCLCSFTPRRCHNHSKGAILVSCYCANGVPKEIAILHHFFDFFRCTGQIVTFYTYIC